MDRGARGRPRGNGSSNGNRDRSDRRGPRPQDRSDKRGPPQRNFKRAAPAKPTVEKFKFPGVYICKAKGNLLLTRNMNPGKDVYGEKLMTVDTPEGAVEYREWNPYRSKIGAAIIDNIHQMDIKPGCTVLYLGASCGTTVSHVSDIVGPSGTVYAVEFSHRVSRELLTLAKTRPNIVPIIDDARYPSRYRMFVPMVDVLFADVAQPDQSRIFAINAQQFLKNGGYFMISIKASCVDSTIPAEEVFKQEEEALVKAGFNPKERVDISEHHRGHIVIAGAYRN